MVELTNKTGIGISIRQNLLGFVVTLATLILFTTASAYAQGVQDAGDLFGPDTLADPNSSEAPDRFQAAHGEDTLQRLRFWNERALKANALDHTPARPGENRKSGEQAGPVRTARAFAIVHIAIFDAVNAIAGGFKSYTDIPPAPRGASIDAAIAQAAHDTLVALYPAQKDRLDNWLKRDLEEIPNGRKKQDGIDTGAQAAKAILGLRDNDGSQHVEPCVPLRPGEKCPTGGPTYPTSDDPGKWRRDPIGLSPLALGAFWDRVTPFVLKSATQFRLPAPPALNSQAYTDAFLEVKRLGGDGDVTKTERTDEQTIIGIFWAYDGTPRLGTPPRLYNQIAIEIASERRTGVVGLARLLALLNVAMADAGLASWDTKYAFVFWRPVTGIREAEGDGNPDTKGDPKFSPLGAPASNTTGKNFTPPFPAYPSGHATFGSALFQVLRRFYGTDNIAFDFVSDEFNGRTKDNKGNTRPRIERHFSSLSRAEEENGQSRIYLGIHWAFDKTGGKTQGRDVGNFVFDNVFRPAP